MLLLGLNLTCFIPRSLKVIHSLLPSVYNLSV
jgi:hypothetical protein